jgi:hypothetical protein
MVYPESNKSSCYLALATKFAEFENKSGTALAFPGEAIGSAYLLFRSSRAIAVRAPVLGATRYRLLPPNNDRLGALHSWRTGSTSARKLRFCKKSRVLKTKAHSLP